MSANLDLVRSMFVAWERGDFSSAEWADPEIEFSWADGSAADRWKGRTEMAKGQRDFLNAWKGFRTGIHECRELEDERVLVLTYWSGQARTSGLQADQMRRDGAAVFEIRDGRMTKFVAYFDRDRALADLGPEE